MYEISIEKNSTITLNELIDSVKAGEEVVFTESDQPVAKMIGVTNGKPTPRFGSAKGLFTMAEDFDAPLSDFDDYQ